MDLKSRSLPLNEPAVDAKWSIEPLAALAGAAAVLAAGTGGAGAAGEKKEAK